MQKAGKQMSIRLSKQLGLAALAVAAAADGRLTATAADVLLSQSNTIAQGLRAMR